MTNEDLLRSFEAAVERYWMAKEKRLDRLYDEIKPMRSAVLSRMATTSAEVDTDILDVELRVWAAMVGPAGHGHTVPVPTTLDLMRVRRVIAAARVCPIPNAPTHPGARP